MSTTILDEKSVLRARLKASRAGVAREHKVAAARALAEQGLAFLGRLPPHTLVAGFASLPEELPLWPLLRRLDGEGMALALPVMVGKGQPLLFRAWRPGDVTEPGVWGIAQPTADKPAVEPDVLLVPLLAFDANGWRLGYGGGFYDRTLKALRGRKGVVAVGIAYDEQRVDAVPHLPYDERLDWVLTPSAAARCVD